MTEIYTPKAWRSLFGSPSIIIDDNGYIYTPEGYRKAFPDVIGWINYKNNNVYGPDFRSISSTPIAYMVTTDGVTRVYEYGRSQFSDPILFIRDNKIYSYEEYTRWFGGEPGGYVRTDDPKEKGKDEPGGYTPPKTHRESHSGGGAAPGGGLAGILGVALIAGIIYILSDEGRLANAAMVLALLANAGAGIYLLVRKMQGKLFFSWDAKRFGKSLATGIGVYLIAAMILVVLGLGSNIGTGNHISDQGGDQLELAAMLMGLPFVISGLFSETPGSKNAGTGSRPQWKNPPVSKPKNQPVGSRPKNPGGILGYNHKFASCPYCRKIFNAKFPAGVREIDMDCPECGRRVHCKY